MNLVLVNVPLVSVFLVMSACFLTLRSKVIISPCLSMDNSCACRFGSYFYRLSHAQKQYTLHIAGMLLQLLPHDARSWIEA